MPRSAKKKRILIGITNNHRFFGQYFKSDIVHVRVQLMDFYSRTIIPFVRITNLTHLCHCVKVNTFINVLANQLGAHMDYMLYVQAKMNSHYFKFFPRATTTRRYKTLF